METDEMRETGETEQERCNLQVEAPSFLSVREKKKKLLVRKKKGSDMHKEGQRAKQWERE